MVDEITRTEDFEKSNQITLFPNPTKDELNIQFDFNTTESVDVYMTDLLGRNINNWSAFTPSENLSISLKDYTSGIYYFIFQLNENKIVKKVILY